MLREAGKIAHEKDFFLFGSQSLRAICPRYPSEFPKTLEADLYPRRHPEAWTLLCQKMGRGSKFFQRHGVFLDCVDPAVATLPDGWIERLIPFRTRRTGGVTAWCLEPNDLFASKLAAWRNKDKKFLTAMLRRKFAQPKVVRQRIDHLPVANSRRFELIKALAKLTMAVRSETFSQRTSK